MATVVVLGRVRDVLMFLTEGRGLLSIASGRIVEAVVFRASMELVVARFIVDFVVGCSASVIFGDIVGFVVVSEGSGVVSGS